MKQADRIFLGVLGVFVVFIWIRSTRWMDSAADSLPILAALPVFVWLGGPWRFRDGDWGLNSNWLLVAGICFALGLAGNLTLLLAMSWTASLWAWLSQRVEQEQVSQVKYLLPLPLLAMPWVVLDGAAIGWWFRLSGAEVTAAFFKLLAFDVVHDGTLLVVNGKPISVEAACAGLNTLQSMLIAGVALAFVLLRSRRRYWWNVALLLPLAWLANTLRIIVLSAAALTFSSGFVSGTFHDLSGWLVILLMFLGCWGLFAWQNRLTKTQAA